MDEGAVAECVSAYDAGLAPERIVEKAAVKYLLNELVGLAPGHSVEVRVPPYAAVQAIEGTRHKRGNPPATVECDAKTWIELATGRLEWQEALDSGRLFASGERSDLSRLMPLVPQSG